MAWRDNLQAIFFSGDGIVKKLWFLAFALATAVYGQNAALPVQFCQQGGTQAALSGLLSTNYQQGIIPSCTVTVYLTGTPTLATIYSNNSGTPLSNPFTASSTGQFLVFAAVNTGYDVVLSGGISPNTYPSPVTITGVYASQDFSGASSVSNSDGSLTISPTTGAVVASLNTANANTWTAQQTFLNTSASFVVPSPDNPSSSMTNNQVFLTNGAAVSPSTITLAYSGLASNSGSTGECWNTLGGQTLCGTTWPTSGDLVVSNATNSPAGLAPVNGDCAIGAGGVWTAGSCGSGSVTASPQYEVPYYSASGTASTLTGSTGFTYTPGTPNTLNLTGLFTANGLLLNSSDNQSNWLANGMTSLPSGWNENYFSGIGVAPLYGTGTGPNVGGNTITGYYAAHAALSMSGSAIYGANDAQSYVGDGSGVEDGVLALFGNNVLSRATAAHETVAMGHSALAQTLYGPSDIFIGDHVGFSAWLTNTGYSGNTVVSSNGVFLSSNINPLLVQMAEDSLFGEYIWSYNNGATSTTYTAFGESIFGAFAGECWYNTSANLFMGAYAATVYSGSTCPATLPSGVHNIIISPGLTASDGVTYPPFSQATTATGDIGLGLKGAGTAGYPNPTLGAVTTASGVTAVGGGAFASLTTAGDGSCFGDFCGYTTTVELDGFGYLAGAANTTYTGNAYFAQGAGRYENSANNTYLGHTSGPTGPTSGYNTGEGFAALYQMTGGSGNVANGYEAGCVGTCTNDTDVGYMAASATGTAANAQWGDGTNSVSYTAQFLSWNFLDKYGNINANLILQSSAASSLASASTIAPTASITDVTGSTTIQTITVPTVLVNAGTVTGVCLRLVQAGTWSTGTSGNIALAVTPASGQVLDVCYNSTDTKWYPALASTPVRGTATLSSGTVTVSNAAACAAGSSCIYKFTNCGPNSSTAIGVLSLGTVTAGTSFVINSLSATNTVATGDASTVCWQIN